MLVSPSLSYLVLNLWKYWASLVFNNAQKSTNASLLQKPSYTKSGGPSPSNLTLISSTRRQILRSRYILVPPFQVYFEHLELLLQDENHLVGDGSRPTLDNITSISLSKSHKIIKFKRFRLSQLQGLPNNQRVIVRDIHRKGPLTYNNIHILHLTSKYGQDGS